MDYTHPAFRNPDGSTRIAAIWDQTLREGEPPSGFLYGSEYRTPQINEALASEDPLEIVPSTDANGHGTYMASLAAGSADASNSFVGAAPSAQLAVVRLKEAKEYLREYFFVDEEADAYQENDIMAGVMYLDRLAYELDLPLVFCLGLGSSSGNHGGRNPLSDILTTISRNRRRFVVTGAGNETNSRGHYLGMVAEQDAYENAELSVGEGVTGFTLEMWSQNNELFGIEIISPTGERLPRLGPQIRHWEKNFVFENTIVTLDKSLTFAGNPFQVTFMRFERPAQGIWNIRVFGESVLRGVFHMWLPVEVFRTGEFFFLTANPDTTITIPGDAVGPCTIGGYDSKTGSIYLDSGRGFTIDGQIKPELVAPAVDVIGADAGGGYTEKTGTSAGTAITAGAAALIMEWALVRGNYPEITSESIKSLLIQGANRDPQRGYPDRAWGYCAIIVLS